MGPTSSNETYEHTQTMHSSITSTNNKGWRINFGFFLSFVFFLDSRFPFLFHGATSFFGNFLCFPLVFFGFRRFWFVSYRFLDVFLAICNWGRRANDQELSMRMVYAYMISRLCLISSILTSQMASLESNSGVVNPTNSLENDSKQDDNTYFHTQCYMQKRSASPRSREV